MKVKLRSCYICGSVRFYNEVENCGGDRARAAQNILKQEGLEECTYIGINFHTGSSVRIIYEEKERDFSEFRQIKGTNVWILLNKETELVHK